MSRLGALNGQSAAAPVTPDQVEPAVVATTPHALTDEVFVTLDRFDKTLRFGPVLGWRTAPQELWPARGNVALVTRIHQGEYWFTNWEPDPPAVINSGTRVMNLATVVINDAHLPDIT